jgi:hypothetical protein
MMIFFNNDLITATKKIVNCYFALSLKLYLITNLRNKH